MELEKIAKDRCFYKKYSTRVEWSMGFKNLRAISFFLHELIYWEDCLGYVKIVEKDLFDQSIIPFKVESVDDIYKINNINVSEEVRRLLWYIWMAVKESDREENQPQQS